MAESYFGTFRGKTKRGGRREIQRKRMAEVNLDEILLTYKKDFTNILL